MITAVLDANVLVSGFVAGRPDSAVALVLDAWRAGRYSLIISEHLLAEVIQTFADPYFAARLDPAQVTAIPALLRAHADVVAITATVSGIASHPEDDLVLATAVSARTDYLVTGDERLQAVSVYEDVRIVAPRQFLEILESQ